ncbi:unnamed protein product [Musa acuminata subsp. malaccensis]|uniref:(wild Malaysian banana) hypothetical protein n=1 Tax=Musa acuminata subsp. malaccensis TaxID=214687 RepID=A0A804JEB8_MUSAM|nr:PREDICTED: mitogen-activated protein kinase kinase kinase NPK1-like [Musa acuminata subsp. malaccensis]CAG1845736.1 unnamed protein product [Musa acuminata subsp. malaccensis]
MGISGWRRGRIIGRGTSATVSLATSVSSGDVFAVKSSELSRSWLLQREQRILSALDSPFVVSYFGFDVAAQTPGAGLCYNLFMEYAARGSLSDEIRKQGGRLDELAIRSYACDILGGLAYLHSNGVFHCDLKSQNVLICSGGRAKVADFGCARSAEEEDEDERGWMRGTPMFMAPEVARGEEQSAPADIWALGCTVIEMATGRPPWPLVSDALSALHQIAFATDVPEFPRWISEEGRDFLSRCLRRDPLERWTAEQLLQHPFVAASRVANPPSKSDWISPKSTLDQAFLQSLSDDDDDDDGQVLDQTEEDPFERMQSLIGDAAPNWTWDETWATVRSNGGFPVTESITEDGRSTNPITDSSEQLMLSTNPMETGHVGGNRSSDHNLSETSVLPIAEGRILLKCKTENCTFENANFSLMNNKERTRAPFGHRTPIFPSVMSNSELRINAQLQLLSH